MSTTDPIAGAEMRPLWCLLALWFALACHRVVWVPPTAVLDPDGQHKRCVRVCAHTEQPDACLTRCEGPR